jgi:hypothetical protein
MHDSATMVSTYEFEERRPKMAVGATSHGSNIKYSSSIKAPFIGAFFLLCFETIRNISLLLKSAERLNND